MKKALFLLFQIVLSVQLYSQEILRVEPPHWWTGMKDPALQIMVYGKDLGLINAFVNHQGVRLVNQTRPSNPNYLFLDIEIDPYCPPGKFSIILKNQQHSSQDTIIYSLLAREQRPLRGFNSSDVMYLITPDRFVNGDTTNDQLAEMGDVLDRSAPFDRHGGDIEGIKNRLSYISEMGFSAVWINPVLENKMPRHSYHGYAITDFYRVDPRFGTNESYKDLVKTASNYNIKIIKDMVVNHCGLHHWWMDNPPDDAWINYYQEPYQQTNHRKTLQADPYAAPEDEKIMNQGWFVRTMPDLNLTHPLLEKYMIQNSIWWIEYSGISGIRMDTYPYPDEGFMSKWSEAIMTAYPDFNICGEIWNDHPGIVAYWQKGHPGQRHVSHLPSVFDFPLQSALSKALTTKAGWEDGWITLYETLAKDAQYADPQQLVIFADNHDMSRIHTQVDEDLTKWKLAMAYLLTTRGIPQIYYGTEILMTNKDTDSHGVIRSDFPGGWPGDLTDGFGGNKLQPEQLEAQDFLARLIGWRKTAEVIHWGRTMHFVPKDDIYVYFRYDDNDKIMVILNKHEQPIKLDLSRFRSMIGLSTSGIEIITGKKISVASPLELSMAGPMIIHLSTR